MSRPLTVASLLIGVLLAASPALSPVVAGLSDPVYGIPGAALAADLPSGLVIDMEGVDGEARVEWGPEGVPRIEATSVEAAFYAVGWVHASQRLFQMDLLRRVGLGELASLLGPAGLESDRLAHTLGFPEDVRRAWEIVNSEPRWEELRRILEAYSAGVNAYIEYAVRNNLLPVEYRILGQKPEPWEPLDSIAIGKVFQVMLAWDTDDLVLAGLVDRWGPRVILDLDVIGRSRNAPHALCIIATTWGEAAGGLELSLKRTTLYSGGAEAPGGFPDPWPLLEWLEEATRLWPVLGGASNNWVVSPAASDSGKPIVANDPHLALTSPSLWILQHVRAPGFNVAGATLPGIPLVVIGRNTSIAWGFTNVGSDFVDFWYYEWVGENSYIYKGETLEVQERSVTVKVWNPLTGSYSREEVKVRSTIHGPLIEWGGSRYAVRFTGMGSTGEVIFIYLLNKAGSVGEALAAQRYFAAPVQNMVVADVDGNWAYSPVGRFPERSNLPVLRIEVDGRVYEVINHGFLPFNGSEGEGEWVGFVPIEELPVVYNADVPFIATANSKPFSDECWLDRGLGWNYLDRFRTLRIQDLLNTALAADGGIGLLDSAAVQLDDRDTGVERMVELLVSVVGSTGDDRLDEYLDLLRSWLEQPDWRAQATGGTPLALAWAIKFGENLWAHLAETPEGFGFFRAEHAEALLEDYLNGGEAVSHYFGDPEGLRELAIESLRQALEILTEYYGTGDPSAWVYGELHYYSPDHPFLEAAGLPKAPAPGGPFSVNVAPPDSLSPEEGAPVRVGPSVRLLSDLSKPVLLASLPGGTSGNPFSDYSSNIYEDYWLTGRYLVINLLDPVDEPDLVFRGG